MPHGLETIAAQLGVAVSTVSRALAGKPGVSAQKRATILARARELGIAPDPAAQALRSRRGTGLVVIGARQPTAIVAARNQALFHYGTQHLGHTRVILIASPHELDSAVRQAVAQKCAAIVVSSVRGELAETTRTLLQDRQVPFAAIDAAVNYGDHYAIDRAAGARQCARLLLLNGCRAIAAFSSATLESPDSRLSGLCAGFASLGHTLDERLLVVGHNGSENGYRAMRDLLARQSVDGVFAYSDETAFGVLRALGEAGVRVPTDIQIVGFDNIELSAYGAIPLTTVAQPVDDIVHAAVDGCVEKVRQYDPASVCRRFPTRLVVRASAPIVRHEVRAVVFEETIAGGDETP